MQHYKQLSVYLACLPWTSILLLNAALVIMILSPYLPGPPNKIVIGLSIFGQAIGFLGLLFIPIGLYRIHKIITRELQTSSNQGTTSLPVYMCILPASALITFFCLVNPLSDFSREFAIQRSQNLIVTIENYKDKTGTYPVSLEEIEFAEGWKIPRSNIMGIQSFRYNRFNDAYSLSFSQWRDFGSLEEIVLYDKTKLHQSINSVADYDYKIDLHRVNGAFASYSTKHDSWRYYWCD